MDIVRIKNDLFLFQHSYIEKVLNRLSMFDSKHGNIPLSAHFNTYLSDCPNIKENNNYMKMIPYFNAIGSLMYVMTYTRPDIYSI